VVLPYDRQSCLTDKSCRVLATGFTIKGNRDLKAREKRLLVAVLKEEVVEGLRWYGANRCCAMIMVIAAAMDMFFAPSPSGILWPRKILGLVATGYGILMGLETSRAAHQSTSSRPVTRRSVYCVRFRLHWR
jgi:hypothetical protein